MQAALLPDRGVVKVSGEDARKFLNGLISNDMGKVGPAAARYAALLTPQGKIIVDFIIAEAAPEDGGGFFLDCPRALAPALTEKLNFYKLRAKVLVEDLSAALGVLAIWQGEATSDYGLSYADPRLSALGTRCMLPPDLAAEAAADIGASLTEPDLDQLGGVDFDKGCYVGQEVVSRVEHRSSARSRLVPIAYDDFAPSSGLAVMAGEKEVGTLGSTAKGRGLALLRLDRVADALSAGTPITCGNVPIRLVKPDWAKFAWPGEEKVG
jgi:folate-binding protein YgfZ